MLDSKVPLPVPMEQFAGDYTCHSDEHLATVGQELAFWKERGVSREVLHNAAMMKRKCTIIQIIDQRLYRARGKTGTPNRWRRFKHLFFNLLRRIKIPDVEFTICFDDRPVVEEPNSWPVFGYYKSATHRDILVPAGFHYDQFIGDKNDFRLYEHGEEFDWHKKQASAAWRGTANGVWKSNVYSVNTFPYFPRPRLVMLSRERPDLIDAGFAGTYRQTKDVLKLIKEHSKPPISMHDQMRYKYLIVVGASVVLSCFLFVSHWLTGPLPLLPLRRKRLVGPLPRVPGHVVACDEADGPVLRVFPLVADAVQALCAAKVRLFGPDRPDRVGQGQRRGGAPDCAACDALVAQPPADRGDLLLLGPHAGRVFQDSRL